MEDIDPDFEPQSRPRSCTWPLRRPDFLEKPTAGTTAEGTPAQPEQSQESTPQVPETPDVKQDLAAAATNRKNCSRRNAWGNLSYADLITKAISSAPDQRLTLSQIYDWMVKNVPFFKDKGDSNSSAGWKNSIRHNLSLHSRFMRVQNEGTGKSSWWMLNPDAKPGKSSRRRASSMDTSNPKWEKKRGRAKKKVLEERQKWSTSPTPKLEPGDVDQSPLAFALSSEFRSRASSNASSCGRLSPIMANPHAELNDMHDNEVPPMSPIPYADMAPSQAYDSPDHLQTDQLTSLAQAMTLNTSLNGSVTSVNSEMNSPVEQLRVPTPLRQGGHQPPNSLFQNQPSTTSSNGYMFSSPPPSNYSNCSSDLSPAHSGVQSPYNPYGHNQSMSPISQQRCSPGMTVTDMSQNFGIGMQQQNPGHSQQGTYTTLLNSPEVSFTQTNAILSQQDPMLAHSPMQQDQGLIMHARHNQIQPNCKSPLTMSPTQGNRVPAYPGTNTTLSILLNNPMTSSTQSSQISSQPPPINSHFQSRQQQSAMHSSPLNHGNHHPGMPDKFPSDLEHLDVDMFKGIDCDMESIIKNELDMGDGNLDFNFDSPSVNSKASVPPSWVH